MSLEPSKYSKSNKRRITILEENRATPLTPEFLAISPKAKDEPKPEQTRHFCNRMMLCFIAMGLNWCTSLRVANHFASSIIEVPPLEAVSQTCHKAYNVTREERLRYTKCVESQLGHCNARLDRSKEMEDQRVKVVLMHNADVLKRAEEMSVQCSDSYATLRLALQDWTSNGGSIPMRSSNTLLNPSTSSQCSAEDQEKFNNTLLGTQNIVAMQTEAIELSNEYESESTLTVVRLAEYAKRRAEYDANYLDGHTQSIQDAIYEAVNSIEVPTVPFGDLFQQIEFSAVDMLACTSLDKDARMSDGSMCDINIGSFIEDFYDDAVWKVSVLRDSLYDFQDRMNRYKKNVMRAYGFAKRFYNGVNNSVTRWIVNTFFSGDWFHINLIDITPVDVSFPDVDSDILPQIGSFPNVEMQWNLAVPKIDAFYVDLDNVKLMAAKRVENALNILKNAASRAAGLVPNLPDDYNPPKYVGLNDTVETLEDEVLLHKNKSKVFLSKTRAALGMFSGVSEKFDDPGLDINTPKFNITEIKNRVTNIELSFESLQKPDIDIDLWFLKFNYLSDSFVFVDLIFRAYISIKLLFKYWFATSIAMPKVDLRANKETKNPFRMHPLRAAVAFATSKYGGFTIFVTSSAWIITIVASLYIPLLHSYTSGCVSDTGNGTFVTKNIYTVAYNHAYQDGSALLVEGMDAFDVKRGKSCNSRYTTTAALQNNINANFSAYYDFHEEIKNKMDLLKRCIDGNELDNYFSSSCCGMATYPDCLFDVSESSTVACPIDDRKDIMGIPIPYDKPGVVLRDPSCSIDMNGNEWEINDSIFDCDTLPPCNVKCTGPRKTRIKIASDQCGCTLEWYLHSKWMGSAVAFLLYLLMNMSRVFFLSGVTRLLWKWIYPDRFTMHATCDGDGKLITKISGKSHQDLITAIQIQSSISKERNEDDEKSGNEDAAKELRAKLDRSLKSFYRSGFVYLAGSLVTNVMWIYLVVVMSQSLTPRVWRK